MKQTQSPIGFQLVIGMRPKNRKALSLSGIKIFGERKRDHNGCL